MREREGENGGERNRQEDCVGERKKEIDRERRRTRKRKEGR